MADPAQLRLPGHVRPLSLYATVRTTICPQVFARALQAGVELGITPRHLSEAILILTKIVLHTGRDLDQLTDEDVLAFRDWYLQRDGRTKFGLHGAWDVLVAIGVLPVGSTLRRSTRRGQQPTAVLVDRYGIASGPVRDLLIRYLDERRPSLDYGPFYTLVSVLVGNFWADIEAHHPGIDTIDLPPEVAAAWKERLRVVTRPDGTTRERKNFIDVLIRVRSFYLDLREWALHDPSWPPFAVASPVRKGDTAGLLKVRRKVVAEMHQRTRERLPQLPVLVDAAERHRREQAELLHLAAGTPVGETFAHDGRIYRRTIHKSYINGWASKPAPDTVVVDDCCWSPRSSPACWPPSSTGSAAGTVGSRSSLVTTSTSGPWGQPCPPVPAQARLARCGHQHHDCTEATDRHRRPRRVGRPDRRGIALHRTTSAACSPRKPSPEDSRCTSPRGSSATKPLATTQTYLALFQDDLIRSYRAFVDQRRATRPEAEYREPTEQEWAEFQQHFQLRKLELGTCGRPTPHRATMNTPASLNPSTWIDRC